MGKDQKNVLAGLKFARQINTSRGWKDLGSDSDTLRQIEQLKIVLRHRHELSTDLISKPSKTGYRVLFDGPSKNKELVACLLGKEFTLHVISVDLSRIVSKYIGETEKNLEKIFDSAANGGAILFFDEADALFGKRTEIKDVQDGYANHEESFLLQRIEKYPGLIILATHHKNLIHPEFLRRFHQIINFNGQLLTPSSTGLVQPLHKPKKHEL